MVSLDEKQIHKSNLISTDKAKVFEDFISGRKVSHYDFKVKADLFLFDSIKAFQDDDKILFVKKFTQFSKRNFKVDTPFVHDNYLVFVVVLCSIKFNIGKNWIIRLLKVRDSKNDESKLMDISFKNLLNNNFNNSENSNSIILVAEYLLDTYKLDNQYIKNEYNLITNTSFSFYKDDVLNLLTLRAYDLIILRSLVDDNNEITFLKLFEKNFISKVTLLSKQLYISLWIILVGTAFYFYLTNEAVKKWFGEVDVIFAVFTVFGLSLGGFFSRKKVVNFLERVIKNFFGYFK